VKIAAGVVFILVAIPAVILGFMFMGEYTRAKSLLDKVTDAAYAMDDQKPSEILSSDGKVLYRVSTEFREPVFNISEVPKVVRDATLAAEDKRFYQHGGVDYVALLRMLFTNVREGRLAQGGSTLEMQLAKRLGSNGERTFNRKMQDVALAYRMEQVFTKDQILLLYLNQVYYGSGAFGIKAAADVYLGKRLDQLTPSDAALLARLVRRPSKENPFDDLKASLRNRDVVLGVMRDENMIDEDTFESAKKEKPHIRRRAFGSGAVTFGAPYFVQYVLDFVKKEMPDIDLDSGGYRIQTTLDSRLQDVAEEEVRRVVEANRRRKVTTGAFVLTDADGRIMAMVGGVDFKRNQYNAVTQGHLQPGSAFKPIVYATALNNGVIGEDERISNARYYYDDGYGNQQQISNDNDDYGGSKSIESALAYSINVCAARVMEKTGPSAVVDTAYSAFGFHSHLDPYLSLALGTSVVTPLEMAEAYSVFQLKGDRATPFGVSSVSGPDGSTIRTFEPNIARNVLKPEVCEFMDKCLRAVVTRGTAARYQHAMPPDSRGKTGTTSSNKDAWFCGYTDNLLGIGWVGNERWDKDRKQWNHEAMSSDTFGGTVTVQIWAGVLKKAVEILGPGYHRSNSGNLAHGDDAPPVKTDQANAGGTSAPTGADASAQPGTDAGAVGTRSVDVPPAGEAGGQPAGATPPREPSSTAVPRRQRKSHEEYVEVEVCAETGMLATIYCPETVVRRFRKGHEPKKHCTLHPPN
jgi:penicillin-binding protein 1A